MRFVRWLCRQEAEGMAAMLGDDFVYDDGFQLLPRDRFIAMHRASGSVDELELVDMLCVETTAVVMFNGVDGVTRLRHRYCKMISFQGELVVRMVACSGVIPPRRWRPSVEPW
jgi:hypothetical protein